MKKYAGKIQSMANLTNKPSLPRTGSENMNRVIEDLIVKRGSSAYAMNGDEKAIEALMNQKLSKPQAEDDYSTAVTEDESKRCSFEVELILSKSQRVCF